MRNAVRALVAVARDEGVHPDTISRRVKAGLLVKVNIAGRAYITIESLELYYERARKGEFSKAPKGAAKKAA